MGLAAWALVTWVPAFRDGVPEPVMAALPFALGWAGHTFASLAARHKAPAPAAVPAGTAAPQVPGTAPGGTAAGTGRIVLPPPGTGS